MSWAAPAQPWDLSRYDLTRYNPWYWRRLGEFADICDQRGLVLFHQNYFQHNILEAGAHWADFPWRPANNINETGFPEPPLYAGDKRIFMAEQFYDVPNNIFGDAPISLFAGISGLVGFILVLIVRFAFPNNPDVAAAVTWGALGNFIGLGFAAISDIWINGYTPVAALVGAGLVLIAFASRWAVDAYYTPGKAEPEVLAATAA